MLDKDPRAAGDLKRYHTWRTIQEQTVAAHTWHFVRILLAIWPNCPREVLIDALFHDVGEIGVGDLPYPIKANNPTLKGAVDKIEDETHLRMCIPWKIPAPLKLDDEIKFIVKLAHMIEMWEFGLTEFEMGNHHGRTISDRCMDAAKKIITMSSKSIADAAEHYISKRISTHRGYISKDNNHNDEREI